MLEKILPYDYEVHHITASKNIVADALSRNPIGTYNYSDITGEETHQINYVSPLRQNWADSPLSIQLTLKEAKHDKKYQQLIKTIKNKQKLPPTLID